MPTLLVTLALAGVGGAFSGEVIYKVWSPELVPILLRSTAQGFTIAFARILAALFAVITPTLILANSCLFFVLLFALTVVSGLISLFWITRLPKARELEPQETALVYEESQAQDPVVPSEA